MSERNFDVDLVYLWVDGNDPELKARRNTALGRIELQADSNCEGRFVDTDELLFSLRAVEQFAPWIHRIFIVTDNQVPRWLDTSHPKIEMVSHTDIIPPEFRPTFNSVVIEHHLHRIPGLSEHFLYANDDMYFNRPVTKADFFAADGTPIVRLNRRPLRSLTLWLKKHVQHREISTYNKTILHAGQLVKEKTGRFITHKSHHNIDAYLKSQYEATFEAFREYIIPTLGNAFRSDNDIQRAIYSYYPLATKSARPKFVGRDTSFRLHIDNHRQYAKLERSRPMFFCLNDSQFASDADRVVMRKFLERHFPVPSAFEIV